MNNDIPSNQCNICGSVTFCAHDSSAAALAEIDRLTRELKAAKSIILRSSKLHTKGDAQRDELQAKLSSAEAVVRQVAADTYGREMTVKEFADASGYDS